MQAGWLRYSTNVLLCWVGLPRFPPPRALGLAPLAALSLLPVLCVVGWHPAVLRAAAAGARLQRCSGSPLRPLDGRTHRIAAQFLVRADRC